MLYVNGKLDDPFLTPERALFNFVDTTRPGRELFPRLGATTSFYAFEDLRRRVVAEFRAFGKRYILSTFDSCPTRFREVSRERLVAFLDDANITEEGEGLHDSFDSGDPPGSGF